LGGISALPQRFLEKSSFSILREARFFKKETTVGQENLSSDAVEGKSGSPEDAHY